MANHYIRQDVEQRMILQGFTGGALVVFINDAITEKLDREEELKTK